MNDKGGGGARGEGIWRGVNLDRKFGWRQRREMRVENDSASWCISSKMLMLCWRFPGWSRSSVAKNLPSSAGDVGSVRPLVRELGDLSSQAAATEPVHHSGGALCCSEDLRQPKVNKNKIRQCSRRKAFRRGRRWVQSGVILRTRCSASRNVVRSYFCTKGKGLQGARRWAKGSPSDEERTWGDGAWNLLWAPPVTFELLHTEEGWKTNSSRAHPAVGARVSCLPHIYLGFHSCFTFSFSGFHSISCVTLTYPHTLFQEMARDESWCI